MYVNQNLKIAVIEDNQQMADMIRDYLQQKFPASDVIHYTTGEQALDKMIEEPDVIILDYHLDSEDPRALNGIQILSKLKDRFRSPIIFLSGQERADVAANTMKYGAYDYIVKNETAFHRMEILINNILGHADLKKNLGTQRFFNRLLFILLLIVVAGFILMRMF